MPEDAQGFFFPVDPEQIREHQERHQMTVEMVRHAIDNMVDYLAKDKDHLQAFRWLLQQMGQEGDGRLATWFDGIASDRLKTIYKVCPGCGLNHNELDVSEEEAKKAREYVKTTREEQEKPAETPPLEADYLTPEQVIEAILSNENLSLEWIDQHVSKMKQHPPIPGIEIDMMKLYGLDDLWEENDGKDPEFIGYICLNCGMKYVSVQDRMLKSADECSGCFQKAKFG